MPSVTRASTVSSACTASSSQRAASCSRSNGSNARTAVARASGKGAMEHPASVARGRFRRFEAGRGAPSVSTINTLSPSCLAPARAR